jgi:chemotaxis protein MotB
MGEAQSIKQEDKGAPAWVVTFGDLMSLLLCFFVLLLSFSEMDRQKYKEVAGSLREAFGIQRKTQVFDSPKGDRIIARDFDRELNLTKDADAEALKKKLIKEIESLFPEDIKGLISVDNENGEIIIRMMGETTFDSGKAEIRPSTRPLLIRIARVLEKAKGEIIIAGHTDNVPITGGPFHSNLYLSIARAASVAELFIQDAGFDPKRIATMGFGEYRPVKSNATWQGRQSNRRVEIILSDTPLMQAQKAPDAAVAVKDRSG